MFSFLDEFGEGWLFLGRDRGGGLSSKVIAAKYIALKIINQLHYFNGNNTSFHISLNLHFLLRHLRHLRHRHRHRHHCHWY